MRRFAYLLPALLLLASCSPTWHEDTKTTFYQACTGEAVKWAGSDSVARLYCDCVLEKMQQKYPDENDAIAHIEILAKDTGLINCKQEIIKSINR